MRKNCNEFYNKLFASDIRRDIFNCFFISLFIFSVGNILGAWTGYLKGDDAYFHVARVQYIVANFPNINWYQQAFAGYDPLGFEPPFLYFVIATIQKITGLSTSVLFQLVLFISMATFSIAFYFLSRSLKINRIMSLAFSLLPFTMPEVWNWFVIGGAYLRIPALAFFILAVLVVFRHIGEVNDGVNKTSTYIITITTLSILAMLHPLLWQWSFLILLMTYLLVIKRWRIKILTIIRIFLPVACLAAWLYIPLFGAYLTEFHLVGAAGPSQYTTPLNWRWLISIPSPNNWSNSLGPIILPLSLLLFLIALFNAKTLQKSFEKLRLKLMFSCVTGVFAVYFFIYGWLPMPSNSYLMSSYDYCIFLGLTLVLFSIAVSSILIESKIFSWNSNLPVVAVQIVMVLVVIWGNFTLLPFLKTNESVKSPSALGSINSEVKSITDLAQNIGIKDYRLSNTQRLFQAWLPLYPQIITTGGRSKNDAPHKYYNQWSDSVVSYRLNTADITKVYSDDRPLIIRSTLGGEQNFYSSMFWLDWYGSAGPILSPPFYPQQQTSEGYAKRPQLFEEYSTLTKYGYFYFFKDTNSSPITVASHCEIIAIPFQSGDAPELYTAFLDILSSLNLNSQWIIPVKLDSAGSLVKFDTALVEYGDYITYKDILDDYIISGGHLIVTGVYNTPQSMLNASIDDVGLSFQVEASLLAAPDNSVILAQTPEGPIVYRTLVGQGTLTVMGMTLDALLESDSLAGTILLTEAVAPEISLSQIAAQLDSSSLSYITPGTTGGISMSSGEPDQTVTASNFTVSWNTEKALGQINNSGETIVLTAEFSGENTHNQVNFSAHLSDTVFTSSSGFVQFDIWTDGDPIIDACFESQDHDKYNGYRIQTKKGEWVHNILPLSAFNYPVGYFDTSQEFAFAVNDNQTTGLNGDGETVNIQIKNLSISTPDQLINDGLFSLNFITDHSIDHNQINWTFPLSQSVSADSNAIVRFSLWSDGSYISSVGVTLGQTGKNGYLYFDLPDHVWSGWQDFILPLSYFQWKEGDKIESVDAISLCFNDNVPYQMEAKIRQFRIDNIGIVAMNNPSSYNGLTGTWEQANKYVLTLDDNKNILWKESYMSSWIIKDNLGHEVDYYFAGPGMIYLVAPQDATSITFEMPVPKDRIAGIIISLLSLFGFMVYLVVKFRTGQTSKKNLHKPDTFQ